MGKGIWLEPAYVDAVRRIGVLIQKWLEGLDRLPDLKFYDHGNVMVGASLEPMTFPLLARTPDARDLLDYLCSCYAPEDPLGPTVFQTRCALGAMGFLAGAEVLTHQQIKQMMAGKAPILEFRRGDTGALN